MSDFIKSLEISKNIERTSGEGLQSKEENISLVIVSNWFTHEPNGRKPDWVVLRSFYLSREE